MYRLNRALIQSKQNTLTHKCTWNVNFARMWDEFSFFIGVCYSFSQWNRNFIRIFEKSIKFHVVVFFCIRLMLSHSSRNLFLLRISQVSFSNYSLTWKPYHLSPLNLTLYDNRNIISSWKTLKRIPKNLIIPFPNSFIFIDNSHLCNYNSIAHNRTCAHTKSHCGVICVRIETHAITWMC